MKTPKLLAVGLIACGLVTGGSTVAHATTASPYVTVVWSYAAYPDLTQPQPYIASTPGADLHAFDTLAAGPEWCGKPLQVDVYKLADEHGRSWETLKESGALEYAHDGGFLAYDAGIGTPYRVIYPEESQCTTPTPEPTPTSSPKPSETPTIPVETPTPTPTLEPTPSPTPSATVVPLPPVMPQPSDTPAPSAPVTAPTPTVGTTPPASPTDKPSAVPSTPTSKQTRGSTPASTSSAVPVGGDTSRTELAYTGHNPWPGIGTAAVLVLAGLALLIVRRVRRG